MSKPLITPELLRAVGASSANAGLYAPLLENARVVPGDRFNTITSQNGLAMLVSQLAHESAYFAVLEENKKYSVRRLMQMWPRRFPTEASARPFAWDPTDEDREDIALANFVYGSRLGNEVNGTDDDDGWHFRGTGLIQLTGRYNFTQFGRSVGMSAEKAAEYCRTPEGAVASALWFWRRRNLLIPASRGDVVECTRIIQGADGGLESRIQLFNRAIAALKAV